LITIGVDAHKGIHVALAVDEGGRELAEWHGPNSLEGWCDLAGWAASFNEPEQWGIEGAWSNGRGLAQHLVGLGLTVYEINARWTARERRSSRKPGKSDRLDARAVARCVREEAPKLPLVHAEDDSVLLDLLSNEREAAIAEGTRLRNQIHALLLQVDPQYQQHLPSLTSAAGVRALKSYFAPLAGRLAEHRAASIRRLALRLELAQEQARDVADQIRVLAQARYELLTRLCGVNLLTAGVLAGILGPGPRFATDAELAAYAGAAPIETSSAGLVRHRLNRGGNRRLNAVLYRIVLTQAHYLPTAQAYIARRTSEGKTKREAHRCLRRFVVRAIWHLWQECLQPSSRRFSESAA
jgi:transposase